ncbi:hypothetical protein GGP55_003268 [Salinibacter ruber]|uniref:AlbA family DNA-binding domain-containing protein n=1 Tax=Salinibacter ruber TaxID=146919 RepID=UPI00216A909D|nr:ATP-binding protein [Salinibacter ruber]MCS3632648.1 hypothetical protein [Salinibacter ruber]
MSESVDQSFRLPLFKAAQEFNTTTGTIVELLEKEGMGSSIHGSGFKAKVTGEKAFLVLRKELLGNEKAARKLEEIRSTEEDRPLSQIRFSSKRLEKPEPFDISTKELVHNHEEGSMLEFKETARYHTYRESFSDEIKMEIVRTISSFMNSMGGVLIIGVSDDGDISGLDRDEFNDVDDAKNFMSNLLLSNLGIKCSRYVRVFIDTLSHYNLIRVECDKSSQPIFFSENDGKSSMYVRYIESTVRLDAEGIYEYIPHRFLGNIAANHYEKLVDKLSEMSSVHFAGDGL